MRIREKIFLRDHGKCALCGRDTQKLKRAINHLLAKIQGAAGAQNWSEHTKLCDRYNHVLHVMNAKFCWPLTPEYHIPGVHLRLAGYWEGDHIEPKSEGGPNELENFRTLCIPCHREVTKDLHKKWRHTPTKEAPWRKQRPWK